MYVLHIDQKYTCNKILACLLEVHISLPINYYLMAVCFSPRHLSSIWVFWLIVILPGRRKSSLFTERAWLHCLLLEDCVHTFLLDLHQNRCSLHVLYQVHRCLLHQAPNYLYFKFMTNQEYGYAHTRGRDKVHIQICPKTELGRNLFSFQGAFYYNQLLLSIRKFDTLPTFRRACKDYLFSNSLF